MNNIKPLLIVLTLALFSSISFAHEWEIAFKIVNNGNYVSGFTVNIYEFNESTGTWDATGSSTSVGYSIESGCNIAFDQYTYLGYVYTDNPNYPDVPYSEKYLFRFGNKCVIYKRTGTLTPDASGDWSVTYDTGTEQISEGPTGHTGMWTWQGTTNWSDTYTFTLKNDFNAGNIAFRSMSVSSGTQLTRQESSFPHYVYASADNQTVSIGGSNYKVYFKTWQTTNGSQINNAGFDLIQSYLYPSPTSNEVKASFARVCNLTFQYSFEETTRNGYMTVGDTSRYLSATVYRRDDVSLTATASDQEYLSIIYSFDHWIKNGSNIGGSASYTFTPDIHATYTAYLKPLKPSNTYRNLQFKNPDNSSPTIGSNIRINWSAHPDNRVDGYQIWRKVKHNGNWGSPTLLSTVSSGTTYYIDYDYVYTDGYTDDMLNYDVRARLYYNSSYSYADDAYETTFGKVEAAMLEDNQIALVANELPPVYSITNYPNPFNPTTTINYQLPENGFVTIKVFDLLGKEIATLVNENKSAGYYKVNFDAGKLTSGIYIYTITVNNFIQSKKMLLMK